MQFNVPGQAGRSEGHPPRRTRRSPGRDDAPGRRKSREKAVLPLMLLFLGLLFMMYLVFPKEPGRHIGPSEYDGLVISEVMASNSFAVPDENGLFNDWLDIYNGTGTDVNIEDVTITNRKQKLSFAFPAYLLKEGERVVVFASGRYQLDPSMPFHGKFSIAAAGDHLFMYDPDTYLIDEVVTPAMTTDTSYQLRHMGENGAKEYEITTFYSPGYENSEEGHRAYRTNHSLEAGALILNEICPSPKTGILDEDKEMEDWLELRNTTNQPIPLGGFFLSNNELKPMKWRFPEDAVIPAQGYYLVFCSGKDKLQKNGVPHANFRISAEKAVLLVSDSYGQLVDRIYIENVPRDYSVGRNSMGTLELFAVPTPGQSNDAVR